jgi:hypothetical protein
VPDGFEACPRDLIRELIMASSAADDRKGKWTVMVFMGAGTFEGTLPLEKAAQSDLAEMRAIEPDGPNLDVLVELHDDNGMRREHVGRPSSPFNVPQPQTEVLDGQALIRFIRDVIQTVGPDRMGYTMLVMWGHTFDFAFGRRRNRDGTEDALDFAELRAQLDEFQKSMGYAMLDIVGFDSCEASTVEMVCQLRPYAHYLLSSEVGIPLPGWPYDRILDRIKNPKGTVMGPAEFGSYAVRRFCESYEAAEDAVSLTLLDLSHADELAARVGWLAHKLAMAVGPVDGLDRIAELFSRSQTEPGRPYIDVADFCVNLMRESDDGGIVAAAAALGDYLVSPQRKVVCGSASGRGRPLVVEHGRNAGSLAKLNGISLYAPNIAPDEDLDKTERLYSNFVFTRMNLWRDLVHGLARS